MPNRTEQILEDLAWRSLDKYIEANPKPIISPRLQHRCKLWIIGQITSEISRNGLTTLPDDYYYPINERGGQKMIKYAHDTLND